MRKMVQWGLADPMHLFIKDSIFLNFCVNFGPGHWDIFWISRNALMNHFFSIVISCEKWKMVLGGFTDPMHLFIEISIFYNFWPSFGPRFWDIFRISGNALMNHFFSIVISYEKVKNGSGRFHGSDAPFHWRFNFLQFWVKFGPRFWDIFSISGSALMNLFLSIVISIEKAKNGSVRVCGSDAPFHWRFNFWQFLA